MREDERDRHRRLIKVAGTVMVVLATIGGATALMQSDASMTSSSPRASVPSNAMVGGTDLDGTWVVHALWSAVERPQPVLAGPDLPRLAFHGGRLSGDTGCNDVFGTYSQTGDRGQDLRFPREQLGSTVVGCSDEPPLVRRLLDVRHIRGAFGVRYLLDQDDAIVAELRAR